MPTACVPEFDKWRFVPSDDDSLRSVATSYGIDHPLEQNYGEVMTAKTRPIPVERDKVEIGPDIDFDSVAARTLAEIPKNEIAMFKWTGIYHALQHGFFMLRVRVPGGILIADAVRGLAQIADDYAEGQLCLTTRQTMQMHWIRKEHLPKVLSALQALGL
ncbi:MAG TPA: hypothetical protein VIV60_23410, partial [Polyangiaceae bacterium]